MPAVVQRAWGGVEVLVPGTLAVPKPGAGEVLVRVHAAGIDRGTWHLTTGTPYLVRLAMGLRAPRQPVPGLDVAGVVVALGEGVTDVVVGDAVCGIGRGAFAGYACVDVKKLAKKPQQATWAEAAVMPVSGLTAFQALRLAQVSAGQRALVLGASGGVGAWLVQLAKHAGVEVTAVCSGNKADFVRGLGAVHVLDRARDDVTSGGPYDVVFDIAGNTKVSRLRAALTNTGTIVFIGGEDAGNISGMGRQLMGLLTSVWHRPQRCVLLTPHQDGADLTRLAQLVDDGVVRPPLDRTFALADVQAAMRALLDGSVRGKLALTLDA
jgi:NADPH:quinone reductase-like Zn-dependent oxidoreductase